MDSLESELLPMLNLSSYNKSAIKMAVRQKQVTACNLWKGIDKIIKTYFESVTF